MEDSSLGRNASPDESAGSEGQAGAKEEQLTHLMRYEHRQWSHVGEKAHLTQHS